MAIKKHFSFDEEADAEKIIKEGFAGKNIDYGQMYLVAKYFRDKLKYGEVRLEREIIKFCKEQDKNFNPIVEAEAIKKWVKTAMNYDLRKVEGITISKKEIDFLKTIEIEKDRKLLFATLIMAKALKDSSTRRKNKSTGTNENYYVRYGNIPDIIKISGVKISEVNACFILFKYKKLFGLYSPEKELIKVEFIDKEQENSFEIKEANKAMEYYEVFFGKPLETCSICGKDFVKKSNRQKMCESCSIEIKRKQSYDRKQKWKDKKARGTH